MSALEGHLHSKCFHVQLQVVSTKFILAHSSHAEDLSPVCNYHVDLQTLPFREHFCITSTYVSTHSSVSFNLYAVSSKKRINTFIITISSSCVPSFNFLSTTLSSSLLTSFLSSWYTTPSVYNPWHALVGVCDACFFYWCDVLTMRCFPILNDAIFCSMFFNF